MPGAEIDKQIDQLLEKSPDADSANVTEEWNPPIPEYPFVERARIADAFLALMPSQSTGKALLLDEFRLSAIWQRFVSCVSRLVAESHSTGTKRRPPMMPFCNERTKT
jgi:hypothetical protein